MRPITVTATGASLTTSAMVRFDDYAPGQVAIQVNVSGSANWTLQSSLDDPNDATSLVTTVAAMTWINSADSNAVGATGNVQTNFQFAPKFARILLNSLSSGTVSATFLQAGSIA